MKSLFLFLCFCLAIYFCLDKFRFSDIADIDCCVTYVSCVLLQQTSEIESGRCSYRSLNLQVTGTVLCIWVNINTSIKQSCKNVKKISWIKENDKGNSPHAFIFKSAEERRSFCNLFCFWVFYFQFWKNWKWLESFN